MPTLDDLPMHSSASEGEPNQLPSPPERKMYWDSAIHVRMPSATPATTPAPLPAFKFPASPPSPQKPPLIDDLMRADLDQLYFDRVHPNLPIFNQSRYSAQSR